MQGRRLKQFGFGDHALVRRVPEENFLGPGWSVIVVHYRLAVRRGRLSTSVKGS